MPNTSMHERDEEVQFELPSHQRCLVEDKKKTVTSTFFVSH